MAPRIASLLASGTEIVCALGLDGQLVAISHECDHPRSILDRPRVTQAKIDGALTSAALDQAVRKLAHEGAALYDIDVKALAALRPDVIITQSQCEVCAVSAEAVRIACQREPALCAAAIVDLQPWTLPDVFADIRKVAQACGAQAAAAEYEAALRRRLDVVRGLTAGLPASTRPVVACVEWLDPIMIAGHWIPELVDIAGGRQPLTRGGGKSTTVPWESLRELDPDVIVLMPCGFDLTRTLQEAGVLASRPGWHDLRAARDRRVFAVDGNAYFNRSGPRLVDSCEILACLLHPGLFPARAAPANSWQRVLAG
jgi:iron complex transport system substrate-binding protein